MYNLYRLIIKNFKILLRSKASALIVIFGPLLIIFLVGVAFDNTNTYAINIGIYSSSYSADTNSFVEQLNTKDFKVVKTDSEEFCLDEIKQGRLHTCIIFPPDLNVQDTDKTNDVVFYVDYSKINLVYMVMDSLSGSFDARSSEISKDLTSVILGKLDETRAEIFNKNPDVLKLIESNENQKAGVDSVGGELNGLNLEFDSGEFKVSEIQELTSSIKTDVAGLKLYLLEQIDDSLDGVSDAKDDLEDVTNNTYVDDAEEELISVQTSLGLARNKTVELTSASTSDVNEIISLLSETSTKIDAVKTQIGGVQSARTTVSSKLSDLVVSLDGSSDILSGIQESFAKIYDKCKNIIVVLHTSPFKEGLTNNKSPFTQYASAYMGSKKLGELLKNYDKITKVIHGHAHNPKKYIVDNIECHNVSFDIKNPKIYRI